MDNKTRKSRKFARVRNLLLSIVICYILINLALNYIILIIGSLGTNFKSNIPPPPTSSSTTTTTTAPLASPPSDEQTKSSSLAFKLKYLYTPPASFDFKLVIVLSAGLSFFICKRLDDRWLIKNGNKGLKGDVRWSEEKDLEKNKDIYCIENQNHLEKAEQSGIIFAKYGDKLYCDASTSNSLIIGTTRSGKGQTFVLPKIRTIACSKAKHSFVVNDPKGEICEYTFSILKDNGYEVVILNLADTNLSSLWNPLEIIKEEYIRAMTTPSADLSQTADMLSSLAMQFTNNPQSDPIWPESAKSLLIAMIFYLLEDAFKKDRLRKDGMTPNLDRITMYSVYQFFIAFGTVNRIKIVNGMKRTVNALDELFQKLPIGNPARSAYATSNFSSGEMRSSIFATLSSNLQIFGSDAGIAKLTSGNQISFAGLIKPDKPQAVFMVVPDEKPSRHVIASLFVNQCYEYLAAESRNYPNNRLPQRVIFELDEFGNMVRIPGMDSKISVSAGRNILWSLYCQDLNQLDTKYNTEAKTIRSNCANVVYIQSIDRDTNEYFSALLGNETIEYRTYSGTLREWLNHQNVNVDSRPLMSAEQLSRLEEGTAITKRMRCYPIKTKLDYFYKLGIKPTAIKDIPLKFIKVDLAKAIYNFAPIGKKIQLLLRNGVFEDVTPAETPQQPSNNSQQSSQSFNSAVTKAIEEQAQQMLKNEKGVPAPAHSEQSKKWEAPKPPAILFKPIPVDEPPAPATNSPSEEENKVIIKLDVFTSSEMSRALMRHDYDTASRLCAKEYKIKRHITQLEYELITNYIDKIK